MTISRIGVHSTIEPTAWRTAWDWKAPHSWWETAWYSRGPKPGDAGHALLFGHLDSTCCPALFWNLHNLRAGDEVQVTYRSGHPLKFRVVWQNVYWNNNHSVGWVFHHTKDRSLLLITCTGVFHYDGTGYDRRLIVYARLVS